MQTVLSCIAFVCVRLIHCVVCNFCVSFRQKLSTVLRYFIMLYSVYVCIFGTHEMKVIDLTKSSSCVDNILTWEKFCQRHVYIARNWCYVIRPGYKEHGY